VNRKSRRALRGFAAVSTTAALTIGGFFVAPAAFADPMDNENSPTSTTTSSTSTSTTSSSDTTSTVTSPSSSTGSDSEETPIQNTNTNTVPDTSTNPVPNQPTSNETLPPIVITIPSGPTIPTTNPTTPVNFEGPSWGESDWTNGRLHLGEAVDVEIKAENDNPTTIHYSYEGALPKGLTYDTNGHLTGTPTELGWFSITVTAADHYDEASIEVSGMVLPEYSAELGIEFEAGTNVADAQTWVYGENLKEGSRFKLTMFSDPVVLVDVTIDESGEFYQELSLPADTADGAHRLLLEATSVNDDAIVREAWFSVLNGKLVEFSTDGPVADPRPAPAAVTTVKVEAANLASTGSDASGVVTGGLLTLLAGAGLLLAARRRREAAQS
jgi:LPXTG-motif cell wall-anchored protein